MGREIKMKNMLSFLRKLKKLTFFVQKLRILELKLKSREIVLICFFQFSSVFVQKLVLESSKGLQTKKEKDKIRYSF